MWCNIGGVCQGSRQKSPDVLSPGRVWTSGDETSTCVSQCGSHFKIKLLLFWFLYHWLVSSSYMWLLMYVHLHMWHNVTITFESEHLPNFLWETLIATSLLSSIHQHVFLMMDTYSFTKCCFIDGEIRSNATCKSLLTWTFCYHVLIG